MSNSVERTPEQIEQEIEQARSEMDATLSAIEHRFTGEHLRHRARGYVGDMPVSVASRVLGIIRHHPLGTAVAGIAVIAVLRSNPKPSVIAGTVGALAGAALAATYIDAHH